MANEKIYANGLFPETRQTSFGEITKLSVKVEEFVEFLNKHKSDKGWVNIDVLTAKDGEKKYAVLNTFQPKQPQAISSPNPQGVDISSKDDEDLLPF